MGKVHPARTGRFAAIGTAIGTLLAFTGFSATPATAVEILGTNNPTAIKDSYIVVFKESDASAQRVDELTNRLAARHDLKVNYTYRHALRGFAGTFSERVARRLAAEGHAVAVLDLTEESAKATVDAITEAGGRREGGDPFRRALLVSLLNPKAILFFVSFFIQFVDPSYGAPALSFLILGAICQFFSITYLSVLIFGGTFLAAQFRRRRRLSAGMTSTVGALFLGFGAKLATASLS